MRSRHEWMTVALLVLAILADASQVGAFNTDLHRTLNGRAANVSRLDSDLKEQFAFTLGLAEIFDGKTARQWIDEGGAAEDMFLGIELLGAAFRSIHHFHYPLRTWDRAGLDAFNILCPPFFLHGEASVRWAQEPDQGISGKAAWGDARRRFHDALTLRARADRDTAFAETFRILGQQMHLIADLAVPAHTRNDPHCPFPDGFEHWAAKPENDAVILALIGGAPIRPDPAIFTVNVPILDEDIAKVPVARLWDSDQYDRTNPNPGVTLSPTIGLAEYTNANFFSDDTVFSPEIPFPARTSVALRALPEEAPGTGGEMRRYFEKVADGDRVDHLAVPGALYDFLPDALKDRNIGLDPKVFTDYAAKVLSRAVGYSAALLDYFFRGRLDGRLEVRTEGGQVRVTARLTNRTPGESMSGTFTLYGDTPEGVRAPLGSWTLTLDPDVESGPVETGPLAGPAPAMPWLLVFRGRLGEELDAVAATQLRAPLHFAVVAQENFLALGESTFVFEQPATPIVMSGVFVANMSEGGLRGQVRLWRYMIPDRPARTLRSQSGADLIVESCFGLCLFPLTVTLVEFDGPPGGSSAEVAAALEQFTVRTNPPTVRRVLGTWTFFDRTPQRIGAELQLPADAHFFGLITDPEIFDDPFPGFDQVGIFSEDGSGLELVE